MSGDLAGPPPPPGWAKTVPISPEYQIYLPAIDTLVTGMGILQLRQIQQLQKMLSPSF